MLFAKVAAQVQLANASSPVDGTVSLRARTTINHGDRTVTLREITVPALRFPADENQIKALQNAATGLLKIAPITVAFDDLVASMQTQAFPLPLRPSSVTIHLASSFKIHLSQRLSLLVIRHWKLSKVMVR